MRSTMHAFHATQHIVWASDRPTHTVGQLHCRRQHFSSPHMDTAASNSHMTCKHTAYWQTLKNQTQSCGKFICGHAVRLQDWLLPSRLWSQTTHGHRICELNQSRPLQFQAAAGAHEAQVRVDGSSTNRSWSSACWPPKRSGPCGRGARLRQLDGHRNGLLGLDVHDSSGSSTVGKRLKVHGRSQVMSACHVLLATQGDGVGTCEAKRAGCHTLAVTLPCTFRRMHCGPSVAAELAKSLVRNLPPMSTPTAIYSSWLRLHCIIKSSL